jgi:hypothetical protein
MIIRQLQLLLEQLLLPFFIDPCIEEIEAALADGYYLFTLQPLVQVAQVDRLVLLDKIMRVTPTAAASATTSSRRSSKRSSSR